MPEKKTKKEKPKKKKPKEKPKKKEKEDVKKKIKEQEKTKEEVKEVPVEKHVEKRPKFEIPEGWKPKTELGRKVLAGEITDIDKVFSEGIKIAEAPIVDILLPDLEKDVLFIGGSTGKGGGI